MTRKVYECHEKIQGKHVYIKRLGTFDFEVSIDNKPVYVQSSNPHDLMRLVKETLNSASGQTELQFNDMEEMDISEEPPTQFDHPIFNKYRSE